jgi:hypothetical protein
MEIHDDVADVLVGQGLARADLFPIRMTKIWTSRDNDCPQALIAYESQEAWITNTLAALFMAGGTARIEDVLPVVNIADCGRKIWGHLSRIVARAVPTCTHARDENINLLRSQEPASRLAKRRHLCSWHSGGDPPLH